MHIEIRELFIKTTVKQKKEGSSANSSGGGNKKESDIDQIVEKVFEIIKEKSER